MGQVALGLGEAGAGFAADGAATGGDEVVRRPDGRPRGQQRLLQRGGGAPGADLGVAGLGEPAVQRVVGLVDQPQGGQGVGRGGVLGLRGGDQGGLGAGDERGEVTVGGQRAGLREVLLRLGAGRHDLLARGHELTLQPSDAVEQRLGVGDRVLRGAAGDDRGAASGVRLGGRRDGLREFVTGRLQLDACDAQQLPGLVEVAGDPLQRGGGVAGAQGGQGRVDLRRPGGDGVEPGAQTGQVLGRGGLQVAELVERGGLGVEALVGGAAGADDVAQHGALRRLVLRHVVVELLLQREAAQHVGPRLLQRGGEPGHRWVPEVCAGRRELLLGRTHRVVGGDEGLAALVGEVLGGYGRELVGGRGRFRRDRLGGPGPAPTAQQVRPAADDHDPADDEHARADAPAASAPAASGTAGAQPVGEGDGGPGPVVRRQPRLQVAADDRVGGGLRQREPVGDRHAVRSVVRGDGQQHALGTQLGEPRGPVGPGLAVGAVERADVDDEQVGALAGGPQAGDRGDDLGPAGGVQHPGAVGDPVGEPRRRIGQRGAGARQQERHQHGDEGGQPAHDDLRGWGNVAHHVGVGPPVGDWHWSGARDRRRWRCGRRRSAPVARHP